MGDAVKGSGIEARSANYSVRSVEKMFRLHIWVVRMGSHGTFVLSRLKSAAFKLFAAINLYSVNYGHMALYRSARRSAKFKNTGRNMVVASKSGPVETRPTVLVATALVGDIGGLYIVCIVFLVSAC